MESALRMLARRARSEAGIRQALERRGVRPAEVRRVLGRLRDLGYVDDRKFAADWSERLQERGFGSLRIRLELHQHGVEERLSERELPAAAEECVTARRVLRVRFGDREIVEPRRKAQAVRFLASRGFPQEVVESVLDLWEE
jgi:regulatory protein